jgi:Fibronectin type III domain
MLQYIVEQINAALAEFAGSYNPALTRLYTDFRALSLQKITERVNGNLTNREVTIDNLLTASTLTLTDIAPADQDNAVRILLLDEENNAKTLTVTELSLLIAPVTPGERQVLAPTPILIEQDYGSPLPDWIFEPFRYLDTNEPVPFNLMYIKSAPTGITINLMERAIGANALFPGNYTVVIEVRDGTTVLSSQTFPITIGLTPGVPDPTPPVVVPVVPLNAPMNLVASEITPTSVRLTWVGVPADNPTGYAVKRQPGSQQVVTVSAPTVTVVITGLTAGDYTYGVVAVRDGDVSALSNQIAVTIPAPAPAPVKSLHIDSYTVAAGAVGGNLKLTGLLPGAATTALRLERTDAAGIYFIREDTIGESLSGTFAAQVPVGTWRGVGLAPGRDGDPTARVESDNTIQVISPTDPVTPPPASSLIATYSNGVVTTTGTLAGATKCNMTLFRSDNSIEDYFPEKQSSDLSNTLTKVLAPGNYFVVAKAVPDNDNSVRSAQFTVAPSGAITKVGLQRNAASTPPAGHTGGYSPNTVGVSVAATGAVQVGLNNGIWTDMSVFTGIPTYGYGNDLDASALVDGNTYPLVLRLTAQPSVQFAVSFYWKATDLNPIVVSNGQVLPNPATQTPITENTTSAPDGIYQ